MTIVMYLIIITASAAFGVGFVDNPNVVLNQGQFSFGFQYLYSSLDPDSATMQRRSDEFFNGVLLDLTTRDTFRLKHKDFNTNRYYGVISYGLTENWEVSLKLGIADVKGKDRAEDEWVGHNFDNDFAWGWGTKFTFHRAENVAWGASVQMNWLDTDWSRTVSTTDGMAVETLRHDVSVKTYDILLAVGPTIDMGGWRLYGGPFYHYLSGDYKDTQTESVTFMGDTITRKDRSKGDLKASGIGGFFGVEIDLAETASLSSSFAATDYGWAIGTGITLKF